jgi:NAD(P)-dependent dehydrogenase (short-subunit alcohol dehydrogenase family)
VALVAATALGGCASMPGSEALAGASVSLNTLPGAPPVEDGRAEFRAVLCPLLRAEGIAPADDALCERWLWRLPDEPAPVPARTVDLPEPQRLAVFLVTGAFSECVDDASRPFSTGAARLQAAGARVETLVVGGRSGPSHNARQIAAAIEAVGLRDDDQVILLGYSKGALDILHFLVDFPALAGKVDAVVSVAGPVFGSPLAEVADAAYSRLVAGLPHDRCPPGDGQVIRSLTPEVATGWLTSNPLPTGVRYYSIAAFTTRDHMSRALVPSWRRLGETDPHNDGQVAAADAVIPGSTLLGHANSDHWAIAQMIEVSHPHLVARPDPTPFPREQLFMAIVQFVVAEIAQGGIAGGGAP